MENIINKYKTKLNELLREYNTDDIFKIDNVKDRTHALDYRDFIKDLKQEYDNDRNHIECNCGHCKDCI